MHTRNNGQLSYRQGGCTKVASGNCDFHPAPSGRNGVGKGGITGAAHEEKVTPSQRLVRTRKQSKSRAERLLVLLSETVAPARCRDEWRALGLAWMTCRQPQALAMHEPPRPHRLFASWRFSRRRWQVE